MKLTIEECERRCQIRMDAGYHLTKYISDYKLVKKGMVATLCCCHDAFVIETDDELSTVVDNMKDQDEELKFTVVRIEDAYLICGDYDTPVEQINCPRVRKLQTITK